MIGKKNFQNETLQNPTQPNLNLGFKIDKKKYDVKILYVWKAFNFFF